MWLNGLTAEGYDEGIQKLVTGCDKCLNFFFYSCTVHLGIIKVHIFIN